MSERVKVVEIDGVEYLVVEDSKPTEVEFRVYYDEMGKIICYTCDKLEGNHIIIDRQAFIEARPDLRVIDGKLTKYVPGVIISKLKPDIEGTSCALEDISIIAQDDCQTQKWKLHSYELR